MQTIIYLHGFRSSAESHKARALGNRLLEVRADWEYITPNLSFDPAIALIQIEAILQRCDKRATTLVGSSLGGFYATVMAEKTSCRAVLLNPSLAPDETLAAHVGVQTNLYSGEEFVFEKNHLDILRRYRPEKITPAQYLIVVEMGDELLDHRKTLARFDSAATCVIEGGDHDLKSFPAHIPRVLAFAGLV